MELGRDWEAVEVLEKAVSLSPETPLLYYDLAGAYTRTGDIFSAQAAYGKVIELSPDSELAERARQAAARLN